MVVSPDQVVVPHPLVPGRPMALKLPISASEEWLLDAPSDVIPSGVLPRMRVAGRPLRTRPWAMPYWRLTAAILLVNALVLVLHLARSDWALGDGSALSALSALVLVN